jgi:uncharacterized protein (TIGR02466 family)
MELLNLRAIPIAYERRAYNITSKELNIIKNTPYRHSQIGHSLSKSISLLNHKGLSSLKKFILKKTNEYVRDVLEIEDQVYLTQSWSTINTTNAYHKTHTHPNTFISAVYYAQCKDGFLCFDLPTTSIRECLNLQFTINKFNIYNSQVWELLVGTGDIVFFPGHIRHGSTVNRLAEDRIVIGANFFIKGKLGSKLNVDLIGVQPLELKN